MSPPPAGARKARQVSAIYHTNGARAKSRRASFRAETRSMEILTTTAPGVPHQLLAEAFFFFPLSDNYFNYWTPWLFASERVRHFILLRVIICHDKKDALARIGWPLFILSCSVHDHCRTSQAVTL